MVDWLWVPLTHRLVARNRKSAMSWSAVTASIVANRVAVSTPLRTDGLLMVLVIRSRVKQTTAAAHP